MMDFEVLSTDGSARLGQITTARGSVQTPVFMPVGTRGAVRLLAADDLESLGSEIILGNTYHLMLRPGAELIAELGGLHAFEDWSRFILTDSGGYQVFSLDPKVSDEGAEFRSTYDGSRHLLTPERAVDVQCQLGSDIQMVLDICPPLPSEDSVIRDAVTRTAAWAQRARTAFLAQTADHGQSDHEAARLARLNQFGIVQGGLDLALRVESAQRTVEIGFEGYAIGGLSVGEDRNEMLEPMQAALSVLPGDQPRYLMGVGDPISLIEAIGAGIDMFDCVLPTRLARHGTALTSEGRLNLGAARYARDDAPIDPGFPDSPVSRYSRAYVRHLLSVNEPTAARILTLHNLAWIFALVDRARAAIRQGTLNELLEGVCAVWER